MRIEVSLVPRIPPRIPTDFLTDSHGRKWDISCKSRSVPGRLRNSPVLGEKLRNWTVHMRILYPVVCRKESGNVIFSWLSGSIQPCSCSVSVCRVFFLMGGFILRILENDSCRLISHVNQDNQGTFLRALLFDLRCCGGAVGLPLPEGRRTCFGHGPCAKMWSSTHV